MHNFLTPGMTISRISRTSTLVGLVALAACGDIGLSAGPAGTPETSGTTTAGTTTSGTTTSGTTTSTTSGTTGTTTGSTTSSTTGTTTSGASACATTTETYANFGEAWISANCIACHDSAAPTDLSTLAAVQNNRSDAAAAITNGSMPQQATLSATDKTNGLAWLNCNPLP